MQIEVRKLRGMPLARVAATVVAATAALALPGVASATVFTDGTGDSGTAPDIRTVEVTNNARGRITMRIRFANRTSDLQTNDYIVIFLNTDRNAATGDADGADHAIEFRQGAFNVSQWNGSEYASIEARSARAGMRNDVITFEIDRQELANTRGFELLALAARIAGTDIEALDRAPDTGEWVFQLASFCVVPRVTGTSLAAARAAVTRAGCRVGRVTRRSSAAPRNRVIGQSPRAGTQRARGTRVNLTVSRGRRR